MSVKITAPDAEHMPGEIVSNYGLTSIRFVDGVATVDDLPEAIEHYMLRAGYKVGGKQYSAEQLGLPEPSTVDARDYAEPQIVGTPLRDAAVDPAPGDFLPPVNAGEADPHGPLVVAPGIHAEGERVVAAGPVSPDPEVQSASESRLAEKLLVDREPVSQPSGADWKEGTGPLGLSDPLSAAEGVERAKAGHDKLEGEPKGGATREAWAEFAKSQGATEAQLADPKDGGLSRDELRATFGS